MNCVIAEVKFALQTGDPDSVLHTTIPALTKNRSDIFRRSDFISCFSWAIPSHDSIDKLVKFFADKGEILEVGAGLGFWAALLQAHYIEVIPTDPFRSHGLEKITPNQITKRTFTDVECMDHLEAIKTYNTPCLFLCWPSYNDPFAAEALTAFQGKYLIYIGEAEGGCTADDKFFELLSENWTRLEYISIPSWDSIYDGICIYVRNEPDRSSCCPADRDDDSVCSDLNE